MKNVLEPINFWKYQYELGTFTLKLRNILRWIFRIHWFKIARIPLSKIHMFACKHIGRIFSLVQLFMHLFLKIKKSYTHCVLVSIICKYKLLDLLFQAQSLFLSCTHTIKDAASIQKLFFDSMHYGAFYRILVHKNRIFFETAPF